MSGNYPDDIRNYDSHPQSPFYEEPYSQCADCDDWFPPEEMDEDDPRLCENCANV